MKKIVRLNGSIPGSRSGGAPMRYKVLPCLALFLVMSSGLVEAGDVGIPLLTSPVQRQQRPLPDNLNDPDAYSMEHIRERTQQRQQAYQKSSQTTRPQVLRDDLPIASDVPASSPASPAVSPSVDVVQQAGRTLLAAKHTERHQPVTETLLADERQARQLMRQLKEVDRGGTAISSAPSPQAQKPTKRPEDTAQTQSLMTLGTTMRQRKEESSKLQNGSSGPQGSPPPDTSLLEQAFQDSVIQRHRYLGQKMETVGKLEGEARYKAMGVLDAQLSQPKTPRTVNRTPSPTLRIMTDHRPVKIATEEKQ